MSYYKKAGYKVITNNEIKEIKKLTKNKVVVFAGQSGAGKSTLLNKLDKSLLLETNEISKILYTILIIIICIILGVYLGKLIMG